MNIPSNWFIFILASGTSVVLTTIAYRRRSALGARFIFFYGVTLAIWALASIFFTVGVSNQEIYLAGFSQLFSSVSATLFFCFTLDFSSRSTWFTNRNVLMLILEPLITLFVLISNSTINLFFNSTTTEILPGPWYWINLIYFNALVASAAYVIIKTFMHGPLPHRLQSGIVLAGAVFILPASLISIQLTSPTTASLVLLSAFTLTGMSLSFGLISYRLLDIVPIPRDIVIERMGDGWMMLDMQNRIVDLNPAAEASDRTSHVQKIYGLPAENVLTDWSSIIHSNDKSKEMDVRGRINLQNMWRYLNLRVSPLLDSNGNQFGRLIVWKDITESKRIEEARQLARDEMFMLLHSISNAASRAANIDEFLEDTIYQIVYSFKSQASVVLLVRRNCQYI